MSRSILSARSCSRARQASASSVKESGRRLVRQRASVTLDADAVASAVRVFTDWANSALAHGLFSSVTANGDKFLVSTDDTCYRVEFTDFGVLVSNAYSTVEKIVTDRPAAVAARRIAQSVFGVDSGFTVVKRRVLSSGVEFSTPNGRSFIVQGDNSRVTLGLYDLLCDTLSEHCVTMLPLLMGGSTDVDLVGSAVSALEPLMVSIRSGLLSDVCVTELGSLMVTPADVSTVCNANRYFGDNGTACSSAVSSASVPVTMGVRLLDDRFLVSGVVEDGHVRRSFSLKCSLDRDVLNGYLAMEGASKGDLRGGVTSTAVDSCRLLMSSLDGENTLRSSAGAVFSIERLVGASKTPVLESFPSDVRCQASLVRSAVFVL